MKRLEDVLIYSDEKYYSTFPSIVTRPDGELLVTFRRAPDRRLFFGEKYTHSDPNSYLVLVRSRDLGRTWSKEPELICAHPMGGSQDPCMVQLDDGCLLVTSYLWALLPEESLPRSNPPAKKWAYGWAFTFMGGYLVKSADAGRTWTEPIVPPVLKGQAHHFPGVPITAHNRGAMVQARDGCLYWISQYAARKNPRQVGIALLWSEDRGLNWKDGGVVALDDKVEFNETSVVETPKGDLVAFVRTEGYDDHGVVVRSKDMGKTWSKWKDMGVIGHPHHAVQLPDGRFFLVYGYRHKPYGIRARLLDPECTDFRGEELVIRNDGGGGDIGYPWATVLPDGRVLATYYFNIKDGTRHIAGTFIKV